MRREWSYGAWCSVRYRSRPAGRQGNRHVRTHAPLEPKSTPGRHPAAMSSADPWVGRGSAAAAEDGREPLWLPCPKSHRRWPERRGAAGASIAVSHARAVGAAKIRYSSRNATPHDHALVVQGARSSQLSSPVQSSDTPQAVLAVAVAEEEAWVEDASPGQVDDAAWVYDIGENSDCPVDDPQRSARPGGEVHCATPARAECRTASCGASPSRWLGVLHEVPPQDRGRCTHPHAACDL